MVNDGELWLVTWDNIGIIPYNTYMGGSRAMGVPKNGWMVYFMENPNQWMMTGGTPYDLGNLHGKNVEMNRWTPSAGCLRSSCSEFRSAICATGPCKARIWTR